MGVFLSNISSKIPLKICTAAELPDLAYFSWWLLAIERAWLKFQIGAADDIGSHRGGDKLFARSIRRMRSPSALNSGQSAGRC